MNPAPPLLSAIVLDAVQRLAAAGVPSPRADAELLAAHLLGLSRGELAAAMARGDRWDGGTPDVHDYHALVVRRAAREPVQHLTGRAPFRRLELDVGPGVFVPRPETEVLAGLAVEEADLQSRRRGGEVLVTDLCTGSAAVALAVADEVARARVVALELAEPALAWARRNLAGLPAGRRVELRAGDVMGAAEPGGALADLAGCVDVVTANPPYIPDGAMPVEPEVATHDPHLALFGGGDGLDVPRAVVATAAVLLRPGGLLLMEHADVQGAATRELAELAAWGPVRSVVDLAGRERVLHARRR